MMAISSAVRVIRSVKFSIHMGSERMAAAVMTKEASNNTPNRARAQCGARRWENNNKATAANIMIKPWATNTQNQGP